MEPGKESSQHNPELGQGPPHVINPNHIYQTISAAESDRTEFLAFTLTTLPYEILEAILLCLPAQDLLLCQSVCYCFKEMVATSKPIRRALFLEPFHYSGELSEWQRLKWNPFLETKLAEHLNIRVIGVHRGPRVKMVSHVRFRKESLLDPDCADILLHEHASWKSMLVTQPPATLLMHPSASLFWKTSMESRAQFFHDSTGFTILDMIDCADW